MPIGGLKFFCRNKLRKTVVYKAQASRVIKLGVYGSEMKTWPMQLSLNETGRGA